MPRDKSVAEVKAELQRALASELATRKFSYPRSDGAALPLLELHPMPRAQEALQRARQRSKRPSRQLVYS